MSDLPPLDQPQAWVVVGPDDQRGPYPLELLIGEVLAGRLHESTPVWWPGLGDWTTMNGHPGVAGELARRRQAYANPQAYAPQPAAPAPAPGQYEQAQGYQAGGTYQPASTAPGQDYSTAAYAAAPAPAEPVAAEPVPTEAPDPAADPGPSANGGVAAVEPEATVPDDGEASSTNDNGHSAAFVGLVERSAAVASTVERVDAVGLAIGDTIIAAADAQGFRFSDRSTDDDEDRFSFDGDEGEELSVVVGSVAGHDRTSFRSAVPLRVSVTAAHHSVEAEEHSDEHGAVAVTTTGWGGSATASVALYLPLADYFANGADLDSDAVERDVASAISVVRSRLR